LRTEIAQGAFKPGQKLLSEDELASQYGVSRMTVRQALTDLIDAGIVYRRHGVGTFVSQAHIERDHSKLTNFFETAEEEGILARASVLVGEVIPAKRQVAAALNLQEGEPVIRIKTLRYANDVPVTVHDAHEPYKLFPDLLKKNFERLHIWTHMEEDGYRVKRALHKIDARDADEEMAQLLDIEIEDRFCTRTNGLCGRWHASRFTYCYNRGDTYSLTTVLSR
jgi:GntR family transcriptional regulator